MDWSEVYVFRCWQEGASYDKGCREVFRNNLRVFSLRGPGGGHFTSQWCWKYGLLLLLCLVVAMPPPTRLGETERNLDASAREGLKWLMEELVDFS